MHAAPLALAVCAASSVFALALGIGTAATVPAGSVPATVSVAPPTEAPRERLREIGRARAQTPFCRTIMHDADAAIAPMLAFDARIAKLVDEMDGQDPDRSPLHRAAASHTLLRAYIELWQLSAEGRDEVGALREHALAATDGGQIDALESFADQVDGAKRRQRQLALALGGAIAKLDASAAAGGEENDSSAFLRRPGAPVASDPLPSPPAAVPAGPIADPDDPLTGRVQTKYVANTLGNYLEEEERVFVEERGAAAHIRSAFWGCL